MAKKQRWKRDPKMAAARRRSLEYLKGKLGFDNDMACIDHLIAAFAGAAAGDPNAPYVVLERDTFTRMMNFACTKGGEAVAEKLTGEKCAVTWEPGERFAPIIDDAALWPPAEERELKPHEMHIMQ